MTARFSLSVFVDCDQAVVGVRAYSTQETEEDKETGLPSLP